MTSSQLNITTFIVTTNAVGSLMCSDLFNVGVIQTGVNLEAVHGLFLTLLHSLSFLPFYFILGG